MRGLGLLDGCWMGAGWWPMRVPHGHSMGTPSCVTQVARVRSITAAHGYPTTSGNFPSAGNSCRPLPARHVAAVSVPDGLSEIDQERMVER
jgi:hypothetical protein